LIELPKKRDFQRKGSFEKIIMMSPLLKKVALASLIGSALGEMIHITPITSSLSPHPTCPLRVLRDSIRAQCNLDVMMKCPATSSDFPMFFSPFATGGLMSGNRGSFDDLESMIDEMFSSTLQIFDEAMRSDVVNRQIAEERAMKAFDANLPSFLDEIVSSITSYTSSSASSSSSSGDEPQEEEEEEEEEEVFSSLMGDLMDITRHIQRDSQRRRLSEGDNDPHLEMKDRLARRLTEYVSQTEVFQFPGGGVMRVVSLSPVEEETPRLGFLFREVDECIYSRYKNDDLSKGCSTAVSSFMNFVDARRSGLQQQQQNVAFATQSIQNSPPASILTKESHDAPPADEETLLQTLSEIHQQFKEDSNIRYLVCATILSSILLVTSLCILATKNIWSFFAGVVIIVAALFSTPIFMLAVTGVLVMLVYEQFCPSDENEQEEEEVAGGDFDYVKLEEDKEDNDASDADVQMNKPGQQPRVFIGVPVQVV